MLLHPGLERSPSVAAVDDEEDCIPQVPPMVHFFFQEVELLLETGHHLGGKAGRRVYHHIRHGLGHERQDELRPRALGCDQIFPGRQAALIVVGLLEDLLQLLQSGLLLVAQLGLGELALRNGLITQLNGLIAILLGGLLLHHSAGAGLDQGDGNHLASLIEDLGHADLFADDRFLHVGFPPIKVIG